MQWFTKRAARRFYTVLLITYLLIFVGIGGWRAVRGDWKTAGMLAMNLGPVAIGWVLVMRMKGE